MPENVIYNTKLGFLGSGDDIFVRVQWEAGKVELISKMLVSFANGTAFNIIWEYIEKYAENIGDMEGLEEIKRFLSNNLKSDNTENSDEPMIQPINTIRHILTLYQEQ